MHHIGIYVCVSGSLAITMLQEYLAVVWSYIYMYVYKYICVCIVYVHVRMRVYAYSHPRASLRVRHIRVDTYMETLLCLSLYLSLLACGMFEYVCRKHNEMRETIRANSCLILCLLVVASLRGIQCKWLSCLGKTVEISSPLSGR